MAVDWIQIRLSRIQPKPYAQLWNKALAWILKGTWLFLANQSALFQSRLTTYLFVSLGLAVCIGQSANCTTPTGL